MIVFLKIFRKLRATMLGFLPDDIDTKRKIKFEKIKKKFS